MSAVLPRKFAALQSTLDQERALQAIDPSLSTNEAAALVASMPTKHAQQRNLQAVEICLPAYSDGKYESPVDYLAQIEYQFDQYKVLDPANQHSLLASKLCSKALHYYWVNKARLNSYQKLADSMKEYFCLTEHAVAAALSYLGYDPSVETLRAFNERFKNISKSSTNSLPATQIIKLYLAALASGDSKLARDLIMARDMQQTTVAILQKDLQAKMDQISVVYNESGVSMESSGKEYKQAKNTLAEPPDSGANQIKVAQGMTQEALASLSRALSLPVTAPQPALPSLASAPVVPTRGQNPCGKRACLKCGIEDHIAANCPQRIDWKSRKQVVSKTVALMMDEFENEDTQHIPANFMGVIIPGHAFQLLQQADAPDLPKQLSAFTAAVINYAHAHPQDACAQAYAALARCKGDAMVDELMTHDNPLFERVLAEVRMRSARTQIVEGGNSAVSLQPSITDMLSTLPSKVNPLD